jgi:hypothetical protein
MLRFRCAISQARAIIMSIFQNCITKITGDEIVHSQERKTSWDCSILGYRPATVVDWIEGETIPKCPEVLSIAGLFGVKVYQILDMPVPHEELVKIYKSLTHLQGEIQSRLAQAIWEDDLEMKQKQLTPETEEAKVIRTKSFEKWGFSDSGS